MVEKYCSFFLESEKRLHFTQLYQSHKHWKNIKEPSIGNWILKKHAGSTRHSLQISKVFNAS